MKELLHGQTFGLTYDIVLNTHKEYSIFLEGNSKFLMCLKI